MWRQEGDETKRGGPRESGSGKGGGEAKHQAREKRGGGDKQFLGWKNNEDTRTNSTAQAASTVRSGHQGPLEKSCSVMTSSRFGIIDCITAS